MHNSYVNNALLLNHIKPEVEKILMKNQNSFQRNWSTTSQILNICWIIKRVYAKNLEVTLLLVDFTKVFDSIHRGKMEQILLVYSLPPKTLTAIMMLYRNIKVKVRSLDGEHRFFQHCCWSSARRYISTIFVYKIKENGFTLKKARSRCAMV